MTLHQERLGKGNGGEDLNDFFGGGAIAIRIGHAAECFSKRGSLRGAESFENRAGIRSGVNNVSCAFAALLAKTDVDGGQSERGGLHDAAARVSEEDVDLAE